MRFNLLKPETILYFCPVFRIKRIEEDQYHNNCLTCLLNRNEYHRLAGKQSRKQLYRIFLDDRRYARHHHPSTLSASQALENAGQVE